MTAAAAQVAQGRSPFVITVPDHDVPMKAELAAKAEGEAAEAEGAEAQSVAAAVVPRLDMAAAHDTEDMKRLVHCTVCSCNCARGPVCHEDVLDLAIEAPSLGSGCGQGCGGECPDVLELMSRHPSINDLLAMVHLELVAAAKACKYTLKVGIYCRDGGPEAVAAASLLADALADQRPLACTTLRHLDGDGCGRECGCSVERAELKRQNALARMRVRNMLHLMQRGA